MKETKKTKKEKQKISLPSKLNLSKRGLSIRGARRCALQAHRGCFFFFVSLLCYAAWRWDSHACQFIYTCIYVYISFFFSTASTAGRVGNLTTIRVREYEECITGTGASKAAFPGYDARCVRREQWETNLSLISRMEILSCDAAMRYAATKCQRNE